MKDIKTYTILALTENKPGVLYRIADIFLRRKINIESLHVAEIGRTGQSQFNILIKTDSVTVDKLVKQINKIIEVAEVIKK